MFILKVLFIMLLLFIAALLTEKLFHTSYTLIQLVYQLKADIRTVVKAMLTEAPTRHIFSSQFATELREVTSSYANPAFNIDVINEIQSGVPCIVITFVEDRKLNDDELIELKNLLLLKFKLYLSNRNLTWNTFAYFYKNMQCVIFHLYYSELPEDFENYISRYNMVIKEKSDPDFGILQDDDLNKELNNVN